MAFTYCTVTGSFAMADGSPAAGTLTFELGKRMSNGGQTILPSQVDVTLDDTGSFSQVLASNIDPDTIPADSQWRVDLRVTATEQASYWITVPAVETVDLASLLPDQPLGG